MGETRIIDKFNPTEECKGTDTFAALKVGDPIERIDDGRKGTLADIQISPNGVNDRSLVAILYVVDDKGTFVGTSNKFKPVDDAIYSKEYPTSKMFHVGKKFEDEQ